MDMSSTTSNPSSSAAAIYLRESSVQEFMRNPMKYIDTQSEQSFQDTVNAQIRWRQEYFAAIKSSPSLWAIVNGTQVDTKPPRHFKLKNAKFSSSIESALKAKGWLTGPFDLDPDYQDAESHHDYTDWSLAYKFEDTHHKPWPHYNPLTKKCPAKSMLSKAFKHRKYGDTPAPKSPVDWVNRVGLGWEERTGRPWKGKWAGDGSAPEGSIQRRAEKWDQMQTEGSTGQGNDSSHGPAGPGGDPEAGYTFGVRSNSLPGGVNALQGLPEISETCDTERETQGAGSTGRATEPSDGPAEVSEAGYVYGVRSKSF